MSAAPYRVGVLTTAGYEIRVECATWPAALAVARKLHAEGRDVLVWNDDIADGGHGDDGTEWHDGLTDDETEQLVDAGVYV